MKDQEPNRRGRKEKPVPQKCPDEYTAAERMRLARQSAGKSLSEVGRDLGYSYQYLSQVEVGRRPLNKRLAKQYERLFGCVPGQIVNTIFERPHKSRKRQEPPEQDK